MKEIADMLDENEEMNEELPEENEVVRKSYGEDVKRKKSDSLA